MTVNTAWLTIIGIGDDGLEGLSEKARRLLRSAVLIVAPDRVIRKDDFPEADVRLWSEGFQTILDVIREARETPVCLLATGDPMHFGIGATLARHFARDEMHDPAVAFRLFAGRRPARLGLAGCRLHLTARPSGGKARGLIGTVPQDFGLYLRCGHRP